MSGLENVCRKEICGMNMIFLFLFVLGSAFVIAALCIKYAYRKKLKLCTERVKAEIIDIAMEVSRVDKHSLDYYYAYYPIFKYTYKGTEYKVKSNLGYGKDREAVGNVQDIFINPSNPEQIFRNSHTSQQLFWLFLFVGLFILANAIVLNSVINI